MMKRFAITLVVALLTASAADAYLGQIEASFRSPAGANTRGLARAAGYLYVVDGNERGVIYRMNPDTGKVYDWYVVRWDGANSGLAFSTPSYLWVGCVSNNSVYRARAFTGSVYSSWDAGHDPFGIAPRSSGDGGKGTTHIFTTDNMPDFMFTHWLNGNVVNSFPLGTRSRYDCAYDWRNNLLWRGSGDYIYAHTPTGSIAASFPSPAGSPRGLAYNNRRLWIGCIDNSYIYRVHCPKNFFPVEPASVGRVKALFR
ncbi:MAG: hypothetical protein V3W11_04810 [bacterium]